MTHYLLSIDLNTTRLNNQNYLNLLSGINADKLSIHIYNYIEQKHNKINFNHGELLHQYLGSRKKIALDIPQALDIIELCANNYYDKVLILSGEYESEYLYNKLSQMKVNFSRILPTALHQIDNNNIIQVDYINTANNNFTNNSNSFNRCTDTNICFTNYEPKASNVSYDNLASASDICTNENIDFDLSKAKINIIGTIGENKKIQCTSSSNTKKDFDKNLASVVSTETIENACNLHNVDNILPTKLTPEQFKEIMQEKANCEHNVENTTKPIETKLTAEQIKKIYTYIKLKQLKRDMKSL